MKKMRGQGCGKDGFTLAELLIAVAIIAILVAIAMPLFLGTMDKAEEARDEANKRAIKAVVVEAVLSDPILSRPQKYNTDFRDPDFGLLSPADPGTTARYWMVTAFVAKNGDILVHDIIPFVMESEDKNGNPKDYDPNDILLSGYEWIEEEDFNNLNGTFENPSKFPCKMQNGYYSSVEESRTWVGEHEGAWCYFFSLTASGENFDEFSWDQWLIG